MPRTFAYLRVSTPGQATDNQLTEIQAAGFQIEPRPIVTETVSGAVAAIQRRGFARLLDRLEAGDILVVTKLDRLGRNAMDVVSRSLSSPSSGCAFTAWRWAGST